MYSAGIGQKALDGAPGATNSVFAEALLSLLTQKKYQAWPLSRFAEQLRLSVIRKTIEDYDGYSQIPAYYTQLAKSRTLAGKPVNQPRKYAPQNNRLKIKVRQIPPLSSFLECSSCPEMIVLEKKDGRRLAIGKFELTNHQWQQCVDDKACDNKLPPLQPREERRPITHVSWSDAQDYVKWLSQKMTRESKRKITYRLPDSDEWSLAARARSSHAYSFGDYHQNEQSDLICQYANGADQSVGVLAYSYRNCSDKGGPRDRPCRQL